MKKIKFLLLASLFLIGSPRNSQAAFVAHPVAVTAQTDAVAASAPQQEEAYGTASTTTSFRHQDASQQKHGFFAKVKGFFRSLTEGNNQIAALILCWAAGILGAHRFYLGYTWQGVVQILTLGGFGIWTLIDFIRIVTGDLKPKGGDYSESFLD